jgi:hypothetical protein
MSAPERFGEYMVSVKVEEYAVLFEISKIVGEMVPSGALLYESAENRNDSTEDFAESQRFLSGSIKWDGCSNWDWHTDGCLMHFCGRGEAVSIGTLMTKLYDIAADRLPTFDAEFAA